MGNRNGHYQLHKRLVSIEQRSCARCGSTTDLDAHRLAPSLGYTQDNVQILCKSCHLAVHYQGKFQVGDIVYLNGRTPACIPLIRHRPRTIKAIRYNPDKQCNFYLLGSNSKGNCAGEPATFGYSNYEFRSYQLHPWRSNGHTIGRPRMKRKYIRKSSEALQCLSTQKGQGLPQKTGSMSPVNHHRASQMELGSHQEP